MQPEPRWRNLDLGKLFGLRLIQPLGILRLERNSQAAAEIDDDTISPAVIASRDRVGVVANTSAARWFAASNSSLRFTMNLAPRRAQMRRSSC